MSATPRTDAETLGNIKVEIEFARTLERENARLREELAEVKQENLKLSALVVERDYQITLANKGYDYEGAVEDARHYKEMAEKYKAELAAYRLWAEVEIADLRDDVKRLFGDLFTIKGNAK